MRSVGPGLRGHTHSPGLSSLPAMDISLTTIRMFVHVLAATVWVGGQVVMMGLVPVARTVSPEAPRILARRFGLVSWPAFAVLTFTGIWNALSIDFNDAPSSYKAKFGLKMPRFLSEFYLHCLRSCLSTPA